MTLYFDILRKWNKILQDLFKLFKVSDKQFFVGDNPGQARWKGGHDRDSELLEVNNVVVSGI